MALPVEISLLTMDHAKPAVAILLAIFVSLSFLFPRRGKAAPKYRGFLPFRAIRAWSRDPKRLLLGARKELGDVFTLDLVAKKMTFMSTPANQEWFFQKTDVEISFQQATNRLLKPFLAPGSGDEEVDWDNKTRMGMTMALMGEDRLLKYASVVEMHVRKALADWAKQPSVDLFQSVSRMVVENNLHQIFGPELFAKNPDIMENFYTMEDLAFTPFVWSCPWFPVGTPARCRNARKRVLQIIREEVANRLSNPEKYKKNVDYLQAIIATSVTQKQKDRLPLHMLSIMFGAHANQTATISWTVAHICKDAELKKRVVAEAVEGHIWSNFLDRVPAPPPPFSMNHLSMCKAAVNHTSNLVDDILTIDRCMHETNRKYPMLILAREVALPKVKLGTSDYVARKGEMVCISPYLAHHDPAVYKDPHAYFPDRFADRATLDDLTRRRAFVAWGHGSHRCMGQRYATIVMRTFWSILFSEYNVEVVNKSLPEAQYGFRAVGVPWPPVSEPLMVRVQPL